MPPCADGLVLRWGCVCVMGYWAFFLSFFLSFSFSLPYFFFLSWNGKDGENVFSVFLSLSLSLSLFLFCFLLSFFLCDACSFGQGCASGMQFANRFRNSVKSWDVWSVFPFFAPKQPQDPKAAPETRRDGRGAMEQGRALGDANGRFSGEIVWNEARHMFFHGAAPAAPPWSAFTIEVGGVAWDAPPMLLEEYVMVASAFFPMLCGLLAILEWCLCAARRAREKRQRELEEERARAQRARVEAAARLRQSAQKVKAVAVSTLAAVGAMKEAAREAEERQRIAREAAELAAQLQSAEAAAKAAEEARRAEEAQRRADELKAAAEAHKAEEAALEVAARKHTSQKKKAAIEAAQNVTNPYAGHMAIKDPLPGFAYKDKNTVVAPMKTWRSWFKVFTSSRDTPRSSSPPLTLALPPGISPTKSPTKSPAKAATPPGAASTAIPARAKTPGGPRASPALAVRERASPSPARRPQTPATASKALSTPPKPPPSVGRGMWGGKPAAASPSPPSRPQMSALELAAVAQESHRSAQKSARGTFRKVAPEMNKCAVSPPRATHVDRLAHTPRVEVWSPCATPVATQPPRRACVAMRTACAPCAARVCSRVLRVYYA